MTKEEEFINLIEDLKNLNKEKQKRILQQEQTIESDFSHSCEILNTLYKAEQKRLREIYIEPFIQKYSFLAQESVLQVIKKHHWETYHSLLLKHLWKVPRLLYSFIERVDCIKDKDFILQEIELGDYRIKEEFPIKNKRKRRTERFIDLLITDNNKKWLIVIENKINSRVSRNKNNEGTQLDSYHRYIETNKNFSSFKNKIYILLSYRDNKEDSNENWIYIDYYKIFSSILENYNTTDAIQVDYLKTLYQLLFENREINSDVSLYAVRKFYNDVQSKIK